MSKLSDYKEERAYGCFQLRCMRVTERWLFDEITEEEACDLLSEAGEEDTETALIDWAEQIFELYKLEEE